MTKTSVGFFDVLSELIPLESGPKGSLVHDMLMRCIARDMFGNARKKNFAECSRENLPGLTYILTRS